MVLGALDTPIGLLLLGAGAGLLLGYAAGLLLGLSRGREEVISRARQLMVRGKLDFNIESILKGRTRAE